MPTIPTGKLERELRRLYMQWVHQLPNHEHDLHKYVAKFQKQSMDLIERMGGDISRLGALVDFPAPERLDLSLHIGTIYSDMELAAISAQIGTGLNPTDTARALVRAGVDKSYRRLERLARTETVRAYWKNAWDSVDGLDLVMIWGAEDGPRTCEWCKERDGMVIMWPRVQDHPNGRCTPIPTLRSQVEYKGSIDMNGDIVYDAAWANHNTRPYAPLITDTDIMSVVSGDRPAVLGLNNQTSWNQIADNLNPAAGGATRPTLNCLRVTHGVELRARGLAADVGVTPYTGRGIASYTQRDQLMQVVSSRLMEGIDNPRTTTLDLTMLHWRTPDGKVRIPRMAANAIPGVPHGANGALVQLFEDTVPEGARGFVGIVWKHESAHAMNWVKEDGVIKFFDAQLGKGFVDRDSILQRTAQGGLTMVRTDDLIPQGSITGVLKYD